MDTTLFETLAARGYNRIPVTLETFADLDTPLSVYLKLADAPYSYLLESAHGGDLWARYSIIGLPARRVIRVRGHAATVEIDGAVVETHTLDDPLAWIERYQSRFRVPDADVLHALGHDLPRFTGGLVGYFGYDCVRYVEPRLADGAPPDDIGTPDILLMESTETVVFDAVRGRLSLIVLADPSERGSREAALERLATLARRLRDPLPDRREPALPPRTFGRADFSSSWGRAGFEAAVERIREYIVAGDCMQVVIGHRMSADFPYSPLALYRALRTLNPSPYMYLMNLADHHIVSASPEILARLEGRHVTSRPLAGTRRRGVDEAEDRTLEADLLADPKERAEHLMLIDLHRNDVGRIAETGSVVVTEQFVIERYAHVMHISSNVTGELRAGLTAMDVLRATLPVGTLSGAPKIRAMQIIDELEPVKRGIYGGAVGYLAWNGNMDMAIAIRTALIRNGRLHVQAGAGVVADSQPELEWEECENKARSIVVAATLAASELAGGN